MVIRIMMRLWLGLIVMLSAATVMAATFSVTVDHTTTGIDHTLQLAARLEGSSDDFKLDTTPLEKDFYVTPEPDLRRRGQWREKHFRLGARRRGMLKVPALSVAVHGKKLVSQPFQINILATDGAVDDVHLWVENTLTRKQAWLHQQLAWRMRVLSTYPFAAAPDVHLPSFEGFDVRKLDSAVAGSVVKDGRRLFSMTWNFLLYPRLSGDLRIDRTVVTARLTQRVKTRRFASGNPNFDAGETRMHTKKAHGSVQIVRVRALPPAAAGLPVGQLALTSKLPDAHAYVQEPLTWNIHLSGSGIRPADMPDLRKHLLLDGGLRAVREKPLVSERRKGPLMNVDALYRLILTPSEPGSLQLPAINIAFFNPEQGRIEHALLPSRSMQVLPSRRPRKDEGFEIAAVGSHHHQSEGRHDVAAWWKSAAIGMFMLWLATVAAWICWGRVAGMTLKLPQRRRRAQHPTLREICSAGDAMAQFSAIREMFGVSERVTPLGMLSLFPALRQEGNEIAAWLSVLERGRWQHGELPSPLDKQHVQEMVRAIEAAVDIGDQTAARLFDPAGFGRIGGSE